MKLEADREIEMGDGSFQSIPVRNAAALIAFAAE